MAIGGPPADIFGSIFPTANAPTYNWEANRTASGITQTARSGVAPGGFDAVEFTVDGATGQPAAGWYYVSSDIPAAGEYRYVRFRVRCTASTVSGAAVDWKETILETGDSQARVISVMLVEPDGDLSGIYVSRNIDGSPARTTPDLAIPFNTWGALQYEIRWGTSGFLKYWVNNATYASPDAQSSGTFTLNSPEFGYQLDFPIVALNLPASGAFTIQVADYHYSSGFDSSWT